jgi:hypothetical protein
VSAALVARLAADNPAIAFRLIPDIVAHPVKRSDDTLRLANPALCEFLRALPAVDALLLDMFCVGCFHVLERREHLEQGTWIILGAKVEAIERGEGMVRAARSPSLATKKKIGMARKIF